MSINGKFDRITRADLLEFARRNNIKDAAGIIDRITETASRWPQIANDCGVPRSMIGAIVSYMQLIL